MLHAIFYTLQRNRSEDSLPYSLLNLLSFELFEQSNLQIYKKERYPALFLAKVMLFFCNFVG
jgi:hypothetical protein